MSVLIDLLRPLKHAADELFFALVRLILGRNTGNRARLILIVRSDGIGDTVFFGRFVPALRAHFTGYEFAVCCPSDVAPIVRLIPAFGTVLEYDKARCRRHYLHRLRMLLAVRRLNPTMTIYASFHREHLGDEIAVVSGAATSVVMTGNDECIRGWVRRRHHRLFSRVVEVPDHVPERHKYGLLFDALGVSIDHREQEVELPVLGSAWSDSLPADVRRIVTEGPFAVVAPGASREIKRWPAERYSALVAALRSGRSLGVILIGVQCERPLLDEVASPVPGSVAHCVDVDLCAVVEMIRSASLFIGNDSGPLHLAATLRVPSCGIVGGMHFNEYFPYGSVRVVSHRLDCFECNNQCVYDEVLCLTEISVQDVLRSIGS